MKSGRTSPASSGEVVKKTQKKPSRDTPENRRKGSPLVKTSFKKVLGTDPEKARSETSMDNRNHQGDREPTNRARTFGVSSRSEGNFFKGQGLYRPSGQLVSFSARLTNLSFFCIYLVCIKILLSPLTSIL